MLDRLFDLRGTIRAIARQRVLLLVLLGWGMASGVALTLAQDPIFVASSQVLLPSSALDAEGNKLRDIETEVHVVRSPEILDRAGKTVTPPIGAQDLRRRVHVRAVSSDILEVRAEAGASSDAVRLADAIADEYVAFSHSATSDQAGTAVSILQERAAELDQQIRQLQAVIASNTSRLSGQDRLLPETLRLAAVTDSLRSEQADAARELSSLNTRIAEARLEAALAGQGTRVLAAATEPDHPARPRPLWNVAVGGLAGFLGGAMLALVREQRDRRLRSRDEIAEAVGAPVLASVGVLRCRGVRDCRELLERWVPSAVEALALRQAFTGLGFTPGINAEKRLANLTLVALARDHAGPLLAFKLAAFAARSGTPTTFIVDSEHPSAAQLRAACNAAVRGEGAFRSNLWLYGSATDVETRNVAHAELIVTVVVSDTGSFPIPTWGRETLTALVVSSGFATAESLATTALACLDAGHPMRGILLANPDPSDQTTGRLEVSSSPGRDRDPAQLASTISENGRRTRGARVEADAQQAKTSAPMDPIAMPRTREVILKLLEHLPSRPSNRGPTPGSWREPPTSSTRLEP